MTLLLPLLLQAAASDDARHRRCLELAQGGSPATAITEAEQWRLSGGGFLAQQCLGVALAAQERWSAAADAFERAAGLAGRDPRAAPLWAQAGNARLAAGEYERARVALDGALAAGTLTGLALGEAHLDRARALVAAERELDARADLDAALAHAGDDPLAWLLSATLARRVGDLPRARTDIAEALRRSADDASVQLEAGNIAAASRDEPGARRAWGEAARLAPDSPAGRSAAAALTQFDTRAGAADR